VTCARAGDRAARQLGRVAAVSRVRVARDRAAPQDTARDDQALVLVGRAE